MKKIIVLAVFITLTSLKGFSQEIVTWHTDMDKAFDIAAKEDKPLMLFFTGSDWCGWCIRLQNEVLKTSDFKKWASENVVLVELDFPRKTAQDETLRAQNRELQRIFQVRGYPSVYFAKAQKSADGKKNLNSLGKTGYVKGGPDKWLEVANSIVNKG
ncbi:MAG: thioredoxin family protein [Aestuariibaculum sp.]